MPDTILFPGTPEAPLPPADSPDPLSCETEHTQVALAINSVRHRVLGAGMQGDPAVQGCLSTVQLVGNLLTAVLMQMESTMRYVASTTAEERMGHMKAAGCRVTGPGA
jgi:hypothetical protein